MDPAIARIISNAFTDAPAQRPSLPSPFAATDIGAVGRPGFVALAGAQNFVIDGAGRVGDALVQQSTMGSEPVESCIVTHVRRWAFPAPEGGGTVQVTYPYVFKSSAQ